MRAWRILKSLIRIRFKVCRFHKDTYIQYTHSTHAVSWRVSIAERSKENFKRNRSAYSEMVNFDRSELEDKQGLLSSQLKESKELKTQVTGERRAKPSCSWTAVIGASESERWKSEIYLSMKSCHGQREAFERVQENVRQSKPDTRSLAPQAKDDIFQERMRTFNVFKFSINSDS